MRQTLAKKGEDQLVMGLLLIDKPPDFINASPKSGSTVVEGNYSGCSR